MGKDNDTQLLEGFYGLANDHNSLQIAIDTYSDRFSCDRKNGTFDYYLAVFEPYRDKGYAKEMILMVLRFFFLELAYQKVNITVYSFNNPSMRFHEKLGFMKEGQLRNIIFTKGAYYEGICFGMTREEFELNHG